MRSALPALIDLLFRIQKNAPDLHCHFRPSAFALQAIHLKKKKLIL